MGASAYGPEMIVSKPPSGSTPLPPPSPPTTRQRLCAIFGELFGRLCAIRWLTPMATFTLYYMWALPHEICGIKDYYWPTIPDVTDDEVCAYFILSPIYAPLVAFYCVIIVTWSLIVATAHPIIFTSWGLGLVIIWCCVTVFESFMAACCAGNCCADPAEEDQV